MPSKSLKLLVLAAIAVLVVIVVALGVVFVTMRPSAKVAGNAVTIAVSDRACTPNNVSVAAGAPEFSIHNTSDRAIEWEILSGIMIVAERENIAPGFTVTLTPRLDPGTYEMTCGLVSNPHGGLTVLAANGSTALPPAAPKPADLVGPSAEYRVYVIQSTAAVASATAALAASVKAGDLPSARTHAAAALTSLDHLGPILSLFGSDAASLASGPTGLAALEKSLTDATTTIDLATPANAVASNAIALSAAAHATTAGPHDIIAGASTVVAGLAAKSGTSADAEAQLAGVRKIVDLFKPLALRADKTLAAKLDADLSAVEASLDKSPSGPPPQLADLGADLTDLLSALGLNAA